MSGERRPPAIFLMGPTASGKTDLALALVERLPCEIVSVDSAMVYRGLDIGTAKPGPEILAQAPHRLIDILDPAESYSAARFRADALAAMAEIGAAGRIPLLVGGTGLYFRALEQGLSPLPEADPALRARLEQEAAEHGWAALHARLARIDPVSAARIHPNDPQRLQRALEVHALTGRPLSELWAGQKDQTLPWRPVKLALLPGERDLLRARIARRFQAMLLAGFLDEVAALRARGDLSPANPSMRCVGYRQAWEYLAGAVDRATMVERAIIATGQYAKRQLTWLRGEQGLSGFDPLGTEVVDTVLRRLADEAIR